MVRLSTEFLLFVCRQYLSASSLFRRCGIFLNTEDEETGRRGRRKARSLLEQYTQRIPKTKHDAEQQDLVLPFAADDVQHHVAFHLEDHHPPIVEYDI